MENEKILELINYFGAVNILATVIPSLLINVLIDLTKNLFVFKSRRISLNSLLVFLGILFGVLYYFILDIELFMAITHSFIIVIFSYIFYKLNIYDLLKNIVFAILKKLGIEEKKEDK